MNDFNFILPLEKSSDSELVGIASNNSVDLDNERMSDNALAMMVSKIKEKGVNLFTDHERKFGNIYGRVKEANLVDNQLAVKIGIRKSKMPEILDIEECGAQIGLSVGGAVTDFVWEYNKEKRKKIKVLDKIILNEISLVGIPANPGCFASISSAIAKSAKMQVNTCPVCYSNIDKVCDICLWSE